MRKNSPPQFPSRFPDPRVSDENGLVCYGGVLTADLVLEAYRAGIFPWPHEDMPLLWFSPKRRGVLDFTELHIPRRLKRTIRAWSPRLSFSWNTAFDQVIRACQTVVRKEDSGTWINDEMLATYQELHGMGFAHSLEIWEENTLIAGVYGVCVNGVFSGESMFGLKTNASKIAFIQLVQFLKTHGFLWMDTQMVSPVTGTLGAKEISQDAFLERLQIAHRKRPKNANRNERNREFSDEPSDGPSDGNEGTASALPSRLVNMPLS